MKDNANMSEEWITTKEAAGRLDRSVRHIRTMIQQGKLWGRREGNIWVVHASLSPEPEETEGSPSETPGNMRETVEILKAQLEAKDKQIEGLQQHLEGAAEASQRHDTIVLQLTRQLEQSQRLLEYQGDPWYRRWFRKRRKPLQDGESD